MEQIKNLFVDTTPKDRLVELYQSLIYNPKAEKYGITRTYAEFIYHRLKYIRRVLNLK